jgi:hypothetical protein
MPKLFPFLAAAIVFLCCRGVLSAETAFSWAAFIGQPPAQITAQVGETGQCSSAAHQFTLKEKIEPLTAENFQGWDLPLGAGFILGKSYEAKSISILKCKFKDLATLTAWSRQNAVFKIEIVYNRCDREFGPCFKKQTDFDEAVATKFSSEMVVIPGLGSGQLSSTEGTNFSEVWKSFSDDGVSKVEFGNSTDCFIKGLYGENWRCVAVVKKNDNAYRVIALAQISSGHFWNTETKVYITRQSYFDLAAEHAAFSGFADDVNAVVSKRLEEQNEAEHKRLRRDQMLNSLR